MTLLRVADLSVAFDTPRGRVCAVDRVSFELARGDSLAIVGESGAGKSQAMLAMLGLAPPGATITGSARFDDIELVGLPRRALDRVRGARIAMVFQDPMTSLNPYLTIGTQLVEVLARHRGVRGRIARARATGLLERVELPEPARLLDRYPHELSGGMRQRVMIAAALAGEPDLVVADEPTTALDATVQAQVLELLRDVRAATGIATILITHDLGVVAGQCERVLVMYAGRVVEAGDTAAVFASPRHPYTAALLDALPRIGPGERLVAIPGQPPGAAGHGPGCAYAPRCGAAFERCRRDVPAAVDGVACHLWPGREGAR